jgi:hypothetical protein
MIVVSHPFRLTAILLSGYEAANASVLSVTLLRRTDAFGIQEPQWRLHLVADCAMSNPDPDSDQETRIEHILHLCGDIEDNIGAFLVKSGLPVPSLPQDLIQALPEGGLRSELKEGLLRMSGSLHEQAHDALETLSQHNLLKLRSSANLVELRRG